MCGSVFTDSMPELGKCRPPVILRFRKLECNGSVLPKDVSGREARVQRHAVLLVTPAISTPKGRAGIKTPPV